MVAVVTYDEEVAPAIWCHTVLSSDLSQAYPSVAVSAVAAVIVNVAAAGATADCGVG